MRERDTYRRHRHGLSPQTQKPCLDQAFLELTKFIFIFLKFKNYIIIIIYYKNKNLTKYIKT